MHIIIYFVAFLEGFTTLSVEIVALRKFTPIIWSSSISTSIILGVILLALSYWYYKWWKISASGKNIETTLIRNLIISSIYYFFLTFIFAEFFLQNFLYLTQNYFLAILLASIILFFIPVFLASQTIPLLSELLKWNHSWEKMWKLLFYSTIWSFLGSVWTSTLFFPWIWVNKTAAIAPLFLVICSLLMMYVLKRLHWISVVISSFLLCFYLSFLFHNNLSWKIIYSTSNAYHNINIYNSDDNYTRIFSIDGAYSSGINLRDKTSSFSYIQEVEEKVKELKPKNILVIWAAGFTFPRDISSYDFVEQIDVVDVDKDLKHIAQTYFLEEQLSDKINFYVQPARYFLHNLSDSKKYDLIFIDAYSGKSLPPQVLTKEFFDSLNMYSDNIFLNIITDRKLDSQFSKNLISTIDASFWDFYYKDVQKNSLHQMTNFIMTNNNFSDYKQFDTTQSQIYTDDKHSIELDLFELNNMIIKQ